MINIIRGIKLETYSLFFSVSDHLNDPGYITMTIVTGNETFPEQNITKEDLVIEDELPLVRLHLFTYRQKTL